MKNTIKISLISIFCIPAVILFGQDAEFVHYFNNPVFLNPGFVATNIDPRLIVNHRLQWLSYTATGNGFPSYYVSYDRPVEKIKGGLGLIIMRDESSQGILINHTAALIYSYQRELTKKLNLSLAAQANLSQRNINTNTNDFFLPDMLINERDGFDKSKSKISFDNKKIIYPDFAFGSVCYKSDNNMSFGFSANHLIRPDVSLFGEPFRLPVKLTLHYQSTHILLDNKSETRYLSLGAVIKWQQNYQNISMGSSIRYKNVSLGAWFRTNLNHVDALIFLFDVKISKYKIAYSYDFTVSGLSGYNSLGAHEISLNINLPRSKTSGNGGG